MRAILFHLQAILILIAAILLAQQAAAQSARDFTLPPSEPAQQPQAQGPADDRGVVPVGPRIIRPDGQATPNNSPSISSENGSTTGPATSAQDSVERTQPNQSPRGSQANIFQPGSSRQAGRTEAGQATSTTSIAPQSTLPPAGAEPPNQSAEITAPGDVRPKPSQLDQNSTPDLPQAVITDGLPAPSAIIPPQMEPSLSGGNAAAFAQYLPQNWQWLAAAIIALFIIMIAAIFLRQRRAMKSATMIERPLSSAEPRAMGGTPQNAPMGEANVDMEVEVITLSRSVMNMMLTCRICCKNRSDIALHDVKIFADLASAHRAVAVEDQLAMPHSRLTQRIVIDRIGPHQSYVEQLSLQIPVAQINAFRHGQAILCVPLLRLQISAAEFAKRAENFIIGIAGAMPATKLQPIALHIPPGSYRAVTARRLD